MAKELLKYHHCLLDARGERQMHPIDKPFTIMNMGEEWQDQCGQDRGEALVCLHHAAGRECAADLGETVAR